MTSLESFCAGVSLLLYAVIFQPVHTALSGVLSGKAALYKCIVFTSSSSSSSLSVLLGKVSESSTILIAGRTIQGVGGGGIEALCEMVLTHMTTLKGRDHYILVFLA
jgi:MFS family permease